MRRPLLHCLLVLTLLLQGVGSAWAASRMAAGDVAIAAHLAELPPCHQEAAQAELNQDGNCCGTGVCHCAMACAATPALPLLATTSLFQRQAEPLAELAESHLHAGYHGLPLRPPATLQS